MKRTSVLFIIAACLTIGATAVYAANVHFKGEPRITDEGMTLSFCGALAGLGNQDITIRVTVEGMASANCFNKGGNMAPGQNKVPVVSTVSRTISRREIKNGNVSFCVSTPPLQAVLARELPGAQTTTGRRAYSTSSLKAPPLPWCKVAG